jgi:hypothetical protein
MADNPNIFSLNSMPGIWRDGTQLDSPGYVDGQWVRFQRGRPRKMNGYREVTAVANGPVRGMQIWSRQAIAQVTLFSAFGVEAIQLDKKGSGQALYDRTPTGYAIDGHAIWQTGTMYDSAAGSEKTLLFAHPGSNLEDIDSGLARAVYYGDTASTDALQPITGSEVSGGLVVMSPFLTIFGSDGRVTWSSENEPRNLTTGSSGTARPTGSKIVRGMQVRGQGNSPSALLWSLDSLIRMSYIGGQSVFRFETLTDAVNILSSSSVIEFDGIFYWVGLDRFMMFNGRAQELANIQNRDWFFDNLNYAERQKVHATKVTRYGEIWWFFPKGDATECTHAVIYNVREEIWYDVELGRSSAALSSVIPYPLLTDSTRSVRTTRLLVGNSTGFVVGDTVSGGTSASRGKIRKIVGNYLYVSEISGSTWTDGESITGAMGGSTLLTSSLIVNQYSLWQHEFGKNKVKGDDETGITSFFETANFSWTVGGPGANSAEGLNTFTRLGRVEPDFRMRGQMNMQVIGRESANGVLYESNPSPFTNVTETIDVREQQREIRLRFTSNETHGDYEMGRVMIHIEAGDIRT